MALVVVRTTRALLWLCVFLGTLTFVRRAQKTQFSALGAQSGGGSGPESVLGWFPAEEQGVSTLRDSAEEGNMQRVVAILQSNIKQWSFIESQLLEPNVNLGMPEIFIPLKHLTTTLEILGNIFFVRQELQEAQHCLERACPLMELLPASLLESGENSETSDREREAAAVEDLLSLSPSHSLSVRTHTQRDPSTPTAAAASATNNYAAECFSLLRKVYAQLYGPQDRERGTGGDPERVSFDRFADDDYVEEESESDTERDREGAKTPICSPSENENSHNNVHKNIYESDIHNDLDAEHVSSGCEERERARNRERERAFDAERQIASLRRPFTHLRAELLMIHGQAVHQDVALDNIPLSTAPSKANNKPRQPLKDSSAPPTSSSHTQTRTQAQKSSPSPLPAASSSVEREVERKTHKDKESETDPLSLAPALRQRARTLNSERLSFSEGCRSTQTQTASPSDSPSISPSSSSSAAVLDPLVVHLGGSATSMIAQDLEVLLRRFVQAQREGDKTRMLELVHAAHLYYEKLDANYPQMDEHEQSANEELGASFLLVLHNVLDEGTDFIARELDAWRALGLVLLSPEEVQEEIARGIVRVDAEGRLFFAPEATARGDREAAMMALLDAQFFRKFSGPERNRLLVLSMFDIVQHGEPQLDLALGLSLGILDNDCERLKDASLPLLASSSASSSTHYAARQPLSSPSSVSPSVSVSESDSPLIEDERDQEKRNHRERSVSNNNNNHNNKPSVARGSKRETTRDRQGREKPVFPDDTSSPSSSPSSSQAQHALLYEDETTPLLSLSLSQSAASLRASVPSLRAEQDDWLLRLLLGLVLLTVALVVWLAHSQRERERDKEKERERERGMRRQQGTGVSRERDNIGLFSVLISNVWSEEKSWKDLCAGCVRVLWDGALYAGQVVWGAYLSLCETICVWRERQRDRAKERECVRKREKDSESVRDKEKEKKRDKDKLSPSGSQSLSQPHSLSSYTHTDTHCAVAESITLCESLSLQQTESLSQLEREREKERDTQTETERDGETHTLTHTHSLSVVCERSESEQQCVNDEGERANHTLSQSHSQCWADTHSDSHTNTPTATLGDSLTDTLTTTSLSTRTQSVDRDKEREREREKEKEKEREREKERKSAKIAKREREREKERERQREREKEREREREIEQRLRDAQQREREREREKERRLEAERERRREREREEAQREREREEEREREKQREKEAAARSVALSLAAAASSHNHSNTHGQSTHTLSTSQNGSDSSTQSTTRTTDSAQSVAVSPSRSSQRAHTGTINGAAITVSAASALSLHTQHAPSPSTETKRATAREKDKDTNANGHSQQPRAPTAVTHSMLSYKDAVAPSFSPESPLHTHAHTQGSPHTSHSSTELSPSLSLSLSQALAAPSATVQLKKPSYALAGPPPGLFPTASSASFSAVAVAAAQHSLTPHIPTQNTLVPPTNTLASFPTTENDVLYPFASAEDPYSSLDAVEDGYSDVKSNESGLLSSIGPIGTSTFPSLSPSLSFPSSLGDPLSLPFPLSFADAPLSLSLFPSTTQAEPAMYGHVERERVFERERERERGNDKDNFLLHSVLDDLLASSAPLPPHTHTHRETRSLSDAHPYSTLTAGHGRERYREREGEVGFDLFSGPLSGPLSSLASSAGLPPPAVPPVRGTHPSLATQGFNRFDTLSHVHATPPRGRVSVPLSERESLLERESGKKKEASLVSDLSPHAPVFLPSNLLFSPATPVPAPVNVSAAPVNGTMSMSVSEASSSLLGLHSLSQRAHTMPFSSMQPASAPQSAGLFSSPLAPSLPTHSLGSAHVAHAAHSAHATSALTMNTLDDRILRFLGDDDDDRWESRFL